MWIRIRNKFRGNLFLTLDEDTWHLEKIYKLNNARTLNEWVFLLIEKFRENEVSKRSWNYGSKIMTWMHIWIKVFSILILRYKYIYKYNVSVLDRFVCSIKWTTNQMRFIWICFWTLFNKLLTIYNKQKLIGFYQTQLIE